MSRRPPRATLCPYTTLCRSDPVSYWPLGILAISVGFIVFTIIKLKLHPFLALIFAAVLTGLLTGDLPGMTTENVGLFKSRVTLNDTPGAAANDMLLAVNWSLLGFGNTAAGIGFVVALAAIIGTCMLGSGAADRVVRWLLGIFGEKRAGTSEERCAGKECSYRWLTDLKKK